MRCSKPIELRRNSKGNYPTVPCGQCIHCRITKRDHLVSRILLEHQSNLFGQFWTLTFSDQNLPDTTESIRKMKHNFIWAMQKREYSAGSQMRIRYFGTCEFGSVTNRPHLHLLIWNHTQSKYPETVYKRGLPRPLYHIDTWPHGHCDIQPITTKSARYVAKYVTNFDKPSEPHLRPISFYPQRPPLGLAGLCMYVKKLSQGPTARNIHSSILTLEERKWALPPSFVKHFNRLCWKYGLTVDSDPTSRLLAQRQYEEDQANMTIQQIRRNLRRDGEKERLYEWGEKLKQAKDARLLLSAQRLADARLRSPTNPIATIDAQPDLIAHTQ